MLCASFLSWLSRISSFREVQPDAMVSLYRGGLGCSKFCIGCLSNHRYFSNSF